LVAVGVTTAEMGRAILVVNTLNQTLRVRLNESDGVSGATHEFLNETHGHGLVPTGVEPMVDDGLIVMGAFQVSIVSLKRFKSDDGLYSVPREFAVGRVTIQPPTPSFDTVSKWWNAPANDPAAAHTYTPCEYKTREGTTHSCNPICGSVSVLKTDNGGHINRAAQQPHGRRVTPVVCAELCVRGSLKTDDSALDTRGGRTSRGNTGSRRWAVLDTDIGGDVDDTFALALLLHSTEFDVRMVMCDSHNAKTRAKIVAKTLDIAGRSNITVGYGASWLNNLPCGNMCGWASSYNLSTYPGRVAADGVGALIQIVTEAAAANRTVTLIVIAPCPNIQQFLTRAPHLARNLEVFTMSGSLTDGYTNAPPASAEYNVAADVAAAQLLYSAAWASPLTIAPLDISHKVRLQGAAYSRLLSCANPVALLTLQSSFYWANQGHLTKNYMIEGHLLNVDEETKWLNDPVAVFLATEQRREWVAMEQLNISLPGSGVEKGFTMVLPRGQAGPQNSSGPVLAGVGWRNLSGFVDWLVGRLCLDSPSPPPPPLPPPPRPEAGVSFETVSCVGRSRNARYDPVSYGFPVATAEQTLVVCTGPEGPKLSTGVN
jgi:inosine-uridine nucleoside N-ribohydrolase